MARKMADTKPKADEILKISHRMRGEAIEMLENEFARVLNELGVDDASDVEAENAELFANNAIDVIKTLQKTEVVVLNSKALTAVLDKFALEMREGNWKTLKLGWEDVYAVEIPQYMEILASLAYSEGLKDGKKPEHPWEKAYSTCPIHHKPETKCSKCVLEAEQKGNSANAPSYAPRRR
jgi:hypothetical protein